MKLYEQAEPLEARKCNLSDAIFNDVNLSNASFENVNLSGTRITDANLTGLHITNVNLGGAVIADAVFEGMTINGILVTDLLASYEAMRVLSINSSSHVEDIN